MCGSGREDGAVEGDDRAQIEEPERPFAERLRVQPRQYLDHVALRGYQAFQTADRRMRALVAAGDLDGAIRSYTGGTLGGSSAMFNSYLGMLRNLITINEGGFNGAVSAGEHALRGWTWRPPVVAVLVVVLVLVGAAPRLAEYRA